MKSTPSIRSFRDDDRPAIWKLYGEVFGRDALSRFERRWRWQFYENPANGAAPPQMWVAADGTRIVGFLGSFPQRMKLHDRECVIYHDCDLLVASDMRRQGIGRRLVQAYDDSDNPLSNCLAYAPANGRIRSKAGYRPVRAVRRYFRPYDMRSLVRLYAQSGQLPPAVERLLPIRWIAAAAGSGLNGLARLTNAIRSPKGSRGERRVERCATFGSEFDDLWRRCSRDFSFATVRDRRFVHWRFAEDPLHDHTLFLARDADGQAVGYVAVKVARKGLVCDSRIMDLFCAPHDSVTAEALLYAAIRWLEAEKVDYIYCLGLHPTLRRTVQRYLYVAPARLNSPAWLLWKGSSDRAALVYDDASWHVSLADSDIGFG